MWDRKLKVTINKWNKQENKFIVTHNWMVVMRGARGWGRMKRVKGAKYKMTDGD